jgi:hypothetical protein
MTLFASLVLVLAVTGVMVVGSRKVPAYVLPVGVVPSVTSATKADATGFFRRYPTAFRGCFRVFVAREKDPALVSACYTALPSAVRPEWAEKLLLERMRSSDAAFRRQGIVALQLYLQGQPIDQVAVGEISAAWREESNKVNRALLNGLMARYPKTFPMRPTFHSLSPTPRLSR